MLLKPILLFISALFVNSELPNCVSPLNGSDCGQRPSLVYTHFSPFSLCHAAIWRGCPTKNKFANQNQCLSVCILNNEEKTQRCDVPINTRRCTDHEFEVFTFNMKEKDCVKASWYGCTTENMFHDLKSCMNTCLMQQADEMAEVDTLNELIQEYDKPRIKGVIEKSVEERSGKAYFIEKLQRENKNLRASSDTTNMLLLEP